MLTEGLTLARNFGPWFGGVALAACLAGGWGGYKVGAWQYQSEAEHARADLQTLKADYAAANAEGERAASERRRIAAVASIS